MALSVSISPELNLPITPASSSKEVAFSNDAFAFWKLPVECRAPLAASLGASERVISRYLFEEYLSPRERQPSLALTFYYLIKGLIPVGLRHHLNALAVRARKRLDFPRWPCETALVDFWRDWLRQSLQRLGIADTLHIGFWPHGHRCCIVLTHDVESPFGFEQIQRMTDLEEQYGFRSALNFPLNQYRIDWRKLDDLKARGFEFGAHGLAHDGRLFRSEQDFSALAPLLERFANEQGLVGFRSPSTLRNVEWIKRLSFDYDCSFADTDPYEPQPGGSCSVFPFFLGNMVELPYTVPQDHTLIHLLRRDPLPIWTTKSQWIASMGGMILTLTHPDYSGTQPHLATYGELLKRLNDLECSWRALPSEVALWWRQRSQTHLTIKDGVPLLTGPGSDRAEIRRLSEEALVK
jgi:peptidoglycan/xylan/chitin deacetylase (PgdA/CDA1 family)